MHSGNTRRLVRAGPPPYLHASFIVSVLAEQDYVLCQDVNGLLSPFHETDLRSHSGLLEVELFLFLVPIGVLLDLPESRLLGPQAFLLLLLKSFTLVPIRTFHRPL